MKILRSIRTGLISTGWLCLVHCHLCWDKAPTFSCSPKSLNILFKAFLLFTAILTCRCLVFSLLFSVRAQLMFAEITAPLSTNSTSLDVSKCVCRIFPDIIGMWVTDLREEDLPSMWAAPPNKAGAQIEQWKGEATLHLQVLFYWAAASFADVISWKIRLHLL